MVLNLGAGMNSASAIIIGNEILSGKFADENGPFLIRRLRTLGTRLVRLVTIADDPENIAEEVRRCSAMTDVVFTTGGVGPTHDDLTFEGIALAFGEPLEVHPELLNLLKSYSLPINDATLRMARVPASTELIDSPGLAYPVARIRNVYVFPGVPKLFQSKFEAIAERFRGEKIYCARLYSPQFETGIAEILGTVARRYPDVEIGSYPRFGESNFKVIITFESLSETRLKAARGEIEANIEVVEP
jgi:molybdenum cofactor synthesis domain-containing protein